MNDSLLVQEEYVCLSSSNFLSWVQSRNLAWEYIFFASDLSHPHIPKRESGWARAGGRKNKSSKKDDFIAPSLSHN